MQKAILLSIVVATLLIPIWASGARRPRSGLRVALLAMAVFNLVYLLSVMFLYPRL